MKRITELHEKDGEKNIFYLRKMRITILNISPWKIFGWNHTSSIIKKQFRFKCYVLKIENKYCPITRHLNFNTFMTISSSNRFTRVIVIKGKRNWLTRLKI